MKDMNNILSKIYYQNICSQLLCSINSMIISKKWFIISKNFFPPYIAKFSFSIL